MRDAGCGKGLERDQPSSGNLPARRRLERLDCLATFRKGLRPGPTDPIIATAILDRLLHHSMTLNIRGESYRLKERKKASLLPTAQEPLFENSGCVV